LNKSKEQNKTGYFHNKRKWRLLNDFFLSNESEVFRLDGHQQLALENGFAGVKRDVESEIIQKKIIYGKTIKPGNNNHPRDPKFSFVVQS
jgi:hypothetical protein